MSIFKRPSDIWNGNAAIQIQPPLGPNGDPIDVPAPTVILDRVDVTSSSGRGVVNIDGGHVTISSSFIHDCAATGVYVGGSGSQATLEKTDVLFNGKGNKRNRRGITPGHSGKSNSVLNTSQNVVHLYFRDIILMIRCFQHNYFYRHLHGTGSCHDY